jgi:DNA-binding response OmpR family regulator
VLAVDDDPAMRTLIADYLADQNVRVSVAADSRDMQRVLAAGEVDLVVLDLKLGQEDGLEIVRAVRSESNLPIIVLTGHRRESVDRVVGLELGADDYLTKRELALLTAFLQSPQRVLTREQLLAASRIHDNEVFDRSIDVQILRLRRRLEAEPSAPTLIRTERGVGYVFSSTVEVR